MQNRLLDLYSDYLICQNKYATATGLSDLSGGQISHDKITRFLNSENFDSKTLWKLIKSTVRKIEEKTGGVLIIDDTIEEKPYTDENEIVCWHYSHGKGSHVKGINILSGMIRYADISLPIFYETIKKDVIYFDKKEKKEKRKSAVTKNEYFRNLIKTSCQNQVHFDYVLADNWFGSKENMRYIHEEIKKHFIIGIKSNRTVATCEKTRAKGQFQQVKLLDLKNGEKRQVWLRGLSVPVLLLKKVFTNEDGTTGTIFLVTNDLSIDSEKIYEIYKKRWRIEEYHKSIKQNASLSKSPTKVVRSQKNHIFASIFAYCKLEMLRLKTFLNHFALKYSLVLRANQIAFQELRDLKNKFGIFA
jgi:hypothetical protein